MAILKQKPTLQVQLLIRTRELNAFRGLLLHLRHMNPQQRASWLGENVDTLSRAFSLFAEASSRTLDQSMATDYESIRLSYELVTGLRETEELVEEILGSEQALRS